MTKEQACFPLCELSVLSLPLIFAQRKFSHRTCRDNPTFYFRWKPGLHKCKPPSSGVRKPWSNFWGGSRNFTAVSQRLPRESKNLGQIMEIFVTCIQKFGKKRRLSFQNRNFRPQNAIIIFQISSSQSKHILKKTPPRNSAPRNFGQT